MRAFLIFLLVACQATEPEVKQEAPATEPEVKQEEAEAKPDASVGSDGTESDAASGVDPENEAKMARFMKKLSEGDDKIPIAEKMQKFLKIMQLIQDPKASDNMAEVTKILEEVPELRELLAEMMPKQPAETPEAAKARREKEKAEREERKREREARKNAWFTFGDEKFPYFNTLRYFYFFLCVAAVFSFTAMGVKILAGREQSEQAKLEAKRLEKIEKKARKEAKKTK